VTPTVSGGPITSWSVSPSLPAGLSLDSSTGAISGTPTAVTSSATYTITASNTGGSDAATVTIEVNDVAPTAISYSPNSFTLTKGTAMTTVTPTSTGGTVTSWTVSPSLPAGLLDRWLDWSNFRYANCDHLFHFVHNHRNEHRWQCYSRASRSLSTMLRLPQ
jgi:uncharacterized repeat protein (TIGR01451 family)